MFTVKFTVLLGLAHPFGPQLRPIPLTTFALSIELGYNPQEGKIGDSLASGQRISAVTKRNPVTLQSEEDEGIFGPGSFDDKAKPPARPTSGAKAVPETYTKEMDSLGVMKAYNIQKVRPKRKELAAVVPCPCRPSETAKNPL